MTEVPLGSSLTVTPEEGRAMVAEVEAKHMATDDSVFDGTESAAHTCAVQLLASLDEDMAANVVDAFESLPVETQLWISNLLERNPHTDWARLVKTINGKATLEHAAALREAGW